MAIAIPLLMMAGGAGTMAIAATTLVMAVTGISKKINDAASNVFGEDLVKAANLIGGVYIAYTSIAGTGAEAAAGGAEAGAADAAATTDAATNVTEAATAADTATTAAAGNGTAAADFAGNMPTGSAAQAATAPVTAPTTLAPDAAAAASGGSTPTVQTTAEELAKRKAADAAAQKGASLGGKTGQVSSWWNGLSDQSKAAVIQTGGSMLSGALSGYGQGQKAEQEMALARMRLQNQSTTVARVSPARVTTTTPGALRVR